MKFTLYAEPVHIFHVPDATNRTLHGNLRDFFTIVAGGYTRSADVGGWRKELGGSGREEEEIYTYRVAGLTWSDVKIAAQMILDQGQSDVFIGLPDGRAGWFNASAPAQEPDKPNPDLAGGPTYPCDCRPDYGECCPLCGPTYPVIYHGGHSVDDMLWPEYRGVPDRAKPQLDPAAPAAPRVPKGWDVV